MALQIGDRCPGEVRSKRRVGSSQVGKQVPSLGTPVLVKVRVHVAESMANAGQDRVVGRRDGITQGLAAQHHMGSGLS